MDRRRHRAGGAAAWRILRHRRTADARAWPPSRPGARRRRLADAAVAAARQQRARGVAGAARRASRHYAIEGTRLRAATVLASSHAVYGVTHLASLARLLPERDPHRRHLRDAGPHAGRFRRRRRGRGASDQVRTGDAGRARLRARSGKLRRDRRDHRADLCLAEIRRRGVAARPAIPGATGCCGCRRSCAKARAAPNGWSDQDLQDGFQLTGLFLLRHVLEPRGQGHSDARDGFINAVTRHRAKVAVP